MLVFLALVVYSPAKASEAYTTRDVSLLNVEIVKNERELRRVCDYDKKHKILNGCYRVDTVYVRANLEPDKFVRVFYHEIGHYITEDIRTGDVRPLFNDGPKGVQETVADEFSVYMRTPSLLSVERLAFFNALGTDKALIQALLLANNPNW